MGEVLLKLGLRHWSARESPSAHMHGPLRVGRCLLTTVSLLPDASRLPVASFLMLQFFCCLVSDVQAPPDAGMC